VINEFIIEEPKELLIEDQEFIEEIKETAKERGKLERYHSH